MHFFINPERKVLYIDVDSNKYYPERAEVRDISPGESRKVSTRQQRRICEPAGLQSTREGGTMRAWRKRAMRDFIDKLVALQPPFSDVTELLKLKPVEGGAW
jgi:hypothetical protein